MDNVIDIARHRPPSLRIVNNTSAPKIAPPAPRLRDRLAGLISPDRMRVACMARLGPSLMVWVSEAIDLVDIDFAEEQLAAALKAVREQQARTR